MMYSNYFLDFCKCGMKINTQISFCYLVVGWLMWMKVDQCCTWIQAGLLWSVPESQRLTFKGATGAEKPALQKVETLSRTRWWKYGRNGDLTEVSDAHRQRRREKRERGKCTIWRNVSITLIGFFLKPVVKISHVWRTIPQTSDFLHLDPWHVITCRTEDIPSVCFSFFFFPSSVQVQIHAAWWSDRIHMGRVNHTWQTLQADGGKRGVWAAGPGPHRRRFPTCGETALKQEHVFTCRFPCLRDPHRFSPLSGFRLSSILTVSASFNVCMFKSQHAERLTAREDAQRHLEKLSVQTS